jgi:protein-L-isoaspartate(D-aspartate) O-methyltransferase
MNPGIDIDQARFNMVEQQIRTWEVLDQDILDLLYLVRREEFVPEAYRALAFSDMEIPLGRNPVSSERMWAPKVEARVLQELGVKKTDAALEVGAGSGYFAALLAQRARHVRSVDINPALAAVARANLARVGADNVTVEEGDASRGWVARGPYDVIVLTASTPVVPEALLGQLKLGGRLFAIVGDPPVMAARLFTCTAEGAYMHRDLFETCFPALVNALQPARFHF